jgi:dolichol-phosphate mannosyltransferase
MKRYKLSIVIPAYNEERFIQTLLKRVKDVPTEKIGYDKEIIVVDDGSSDKTFDLASQVEGVTVYRQVPNAGKGQAVQKGVKKATGDFILVQDADLEYDPEDYIPMLMKLDGRKDVAIYGSRILGQLKQGWKFPPGKHEEQGLGPWAAGVILSAWTFGLYGKWLTDTLTAYKIYPAEVIKNFQVKTCGFETDHELTAKLIKAGIRIEEVPIRYTPRSREEGKKIKMQDGFTALWTLLKFRIY